MADITPVDSVWSQTKLLNFQDLGRQRGMRTRLYLVRTRRNGTKLGIVHWDRLLNKYIFEPDISEVKIINPKYGPDLFSFCGWVTRVFRDAHPYKVASFKKRRARRIQNLLKKPDGGGLDKRYAPVV